MYTVLGTDLIICTTLSNSNGTFKFNNQHAALTEEFIVLIRRDKSDIRAVIKPLLRASALLIFLISNDQSARRTHGHNWERLRPFLKMRQDI